MKGSLALLAALAVAVVAAVVYLAREEAAGPRVGAERPTATFSPRAGAGTEAAGPGVFRTGVGARRVDVEEPTLIDTPAGAVELAPGRYDLRVDGDRVDVIVHRGRAVHRRDGEPQVAVAGGVLSVAAERAVAPASTGPPPSGTTTTVTGRVVDGAGKPIAGARIWAGADPATEGRVVATTDASGAYRADDVAERYVGARADGCAPSDLRRIEPATRPVFEMEFVLRDAGGALRVEVVDGEAHPVAGASVLVGDSFRNLPLASRSPDGYPLVAVGGRTLVTDADGIAEARDLPPGWNPLRVVAANFAPYDSHARLPPAVAETRRITLERGVTVHGVVRDARGAPVAGVRIAFRQAGSGRELDGLVAETDARGAYRVESVPARRLEVFARAADGRRANAWLVLERGADRRWDPVLGEAGAIAGRLVYDDDGASVAGARVRCRRVVLAGDRHPDVVTDESGAFSFAPVDDTRHTLLIWLPGVRALAPSATVTMTPDESPKTIRLARADEPGFVAGTVVLPDGAPAAGARLTVWPAEGFGWAARDRAPADGAFRLGPLGPGAHRLEIHVDGRPTLHLDAEIEPGETHDFGVVAFPEAGRIRARIVGPAGAPVDKANVLVASLDLRIHYSVKPDGDGFAISEDLAPGRYYVYGGALGLGREVEVRPGETSEVELKLPPMGTISITFRREDGSAPRAVSYEVRDVAGRRVVSGTLDAGADRFEVSLAAGRYAVAGRDERGREAKAFLDAPADGENIHTLVLR